MKKEYKLIAGKIREQEGREVSLFNMLINIRSTMMGRNIYKEDIVWFRHLLKKQKTWHGDVRNYFSRKYKGFWEEPYMHRPFFGHRYLGKREVLSEDELPF